MSFAYGSMNWTWPYRGVWAVLLRNRYDAEINS
jgi:hypothetical protein